MGIITIGAFRAKPGKEGDLVDLLKHHHGILRLQGLVSEMKPVIARAKDGSFIEIFEWKNQTAIDAAHKNPSVAELWKKFEACSDAVKLADLPEGQGPFASFETYRLPGRF